MKSFFYFLILSIGLSSCAIKPVVYKTMDNWKLNKVSDGINVSNQVTFNNPNKVGCKIKEINLDVYLDNLKVGVINQSTSTVKVPKKSDFTIPLEIIIKPEGSIMDIGKQILNVFSNKNVKLQYKGNLKLKASIVPITVDVNDGQNFMIMDLIKVYRSTGLK